MMISKLDRLMILQEEVLIDKKVCRRTRIQKIWVM